MLLDEAVDKNYINGELVKSRKVGNSHICECGCRLKISEDLRTIYCDNKACKYTMQNKLRQLGIDIAIDKEYENIYELIEDLRNEVQAIDELVEDDEKMVYLGTSMDMNTVKALMKGITVNELYSRIKKEHTNILKNKLGMLDGEAGIAVKYMYELLYVKKSIEKLKTYNGR